MKFLTNCHQTESPRTNLVTKRRHLGKNLVTKPRHPEQTWSPNHITWNRPCNQTTSPGNSLSQNCITQSKPCHQSVSPGAPKQKFSGQGHPIPQGFSLLPRACPNENDGRFAMGRAGQVGKCQLTRFGDKVCPGGHGLVTRFVMGDTF